MSVSPLGNIHFINQNSPVVSHAASTQQARFDMQAAMSAELMADKEKEIEEVRPAEEAYKIDPEHEHQKGQSQSEQNEQNQSQPNAQSEQSELENQSEGYHLDIKI